MDRSRGLDFDANQRVSRFNLIKALIVTCNLHWIINRLFYFCRKFFL